MRDNYGDQELDDALKVLSHPELEATEAFRAWMQQKANRQLYAELKAAYDNLSLNERSLPDAQKEWAHFCLKRLNKHIERKITQPAATPHISPTQKQLSYHFLKWVAVVILLFLIGFTGKWYMGHRPKRPQPIAIMQALPQPQEVVLSNEKGEEVVLSKQTADTLHIAGANIKSRHAIAYNIPSPEEETAEIHTLKTPRGKDFQVTLPDGTIVWLNVESTLRYPSRFAGKERIVELAGEAYFKVSKDAEHPFVVRTKHLTTRVLGTSFNFRSYDNEASHVTLVEGEVAVNTSGSSTSHTLKPGQDASIGPEGNIQIQQVNTQAYTAWTEGYFYFEDVALSQIMKELGRWYNLTVHFQEARTMKYRFNFWAKRDVPIQNTLAQLNLLGKVRATLNENTITIE